MVGEGLESVARNSHYIGQVIMVLKCMIIGECRVGHKAKENGNLGMIGEPVEYVEWVARQSQNRGWVLLIMKSRMVGEGLESVARNSHYIGQVIMVLKCRIIGECRVGHKAKENG